MKRFPRRIAAFSLVEVTVALAITIFCFVVLLAVLLTALASNQATGSQTAANGILSAVADDLRATPSTTPVGEAATSAQFGIAIPANPVASPITSTLYFAGTSQCTTTLAATSRYQLTITFLANGTNAKTATFVNLKVTWPAAAALTNAAGSAQMFIALLGRTGVKVSRVSLGTMTFAADTAMPEGHQLLDWFLAAGGNFIDTADNYTGPARHAEEVVGHWLKGRADRDRLVLATKVRFPTSGDVNDVGLTRKHIVHALEKSLRRLQTDYIDLYQAHCWDPVTPVEETMRAFDDLITAGKVRYIGASNFTGWHLVKANAIGQAQGWTKFVNLQTQYNLLTRSPEWDILPPCRDEGVGVTIWSPLAAGWLSGKYSRDKMPPADSRLAHGVSEPRDWKRLQSAVLGATVPHPHKIESDQEFKKLLRAEDDQRKWRIIDAVADVAKARGKTSAQVALAWLLAQTDVTAVVIGARTLLQLEDNLGCLGWELTPAERAWLEQVSDPGLPYPHDFFAQYGSWR